MEDYDYIFEIYFKPFVGFGITWERKNQEIRIGLPFLIFKYDYHKYCHGISIFGKELLRKQDENPD